MCCLFGIIDYNGFFTQQQKEKVLCVLSTACEDRGTDATGIAYLHNNRLTVYKRPVAAHLLQFHVPHRSKVIMGHTRMTTQGSEQKNYNNHPFLGNLPHSQFALAHNGILYNDRELRRNKRLPKTKIETDSYAAVQIIEQQKTLDFESLKTMAEQVEGSFTFTVMDNKERLYLVKGSNPMCLYHFRENGFYIYASTQEILDQALKATGLIPLPHEKIAITDGDILKVNLDGTLESGTFRMKPDCFGSPSYYGRCVYHSPTPKHSSYHSMLLSYGAQHGVPEEELNILNAMGLDDCDLELAIFDGDYRQEFLLEFFCAQEGWPCMC